MQPTSLTSLPSELLLLILSLLDIPDLLSLSRVSHSFRTLSLDPILHTHRLHRASTTLSYSLSLRPSLASLIAHRIYITRTTLAARSLGRNLISIKLNRRLSHRPSAEELVHWGVLPREVVRNGGRGESGRIIEIKKRIERERVKDLLRGWVEEWRRRGEGLVGREEVSVRRLARRFGREGGIERERERRREEPARAKVLGLRRYWEMVGRAEGGG